MMVAYQDQTMDEQSMPLWRQPSNCVSDSIEKCQAKRVASQAASEVSQEHCKEVQCIETNEQRRSQEFFHAHKPQTPENTDEEKHGETVTNTTENAIELYACDSDPSFDLEKPNTDESLALKRCVVSSRDSALTRSRSCRASFMVIPNSWFDDSVNLNMTPPGKIFQYAPRRPEKVRRSLCPENGGHQNDLSFDYYVGSGKVASDAVTDKGTGNAKEEGVINDISCITEVKQQAEKSHASQPEENKAGFDVTTSTWK